MSEIYCPEGGYGGIGFYVVVERQNVAEYLVNETDYSCDHYKNNPEYKTFKYCPECGGCIYKYTYDPTNLLGYPISGNNYENTEYRVEPKDADVNSLYDLLKTLETKEIPYDNIVYAEYECDCGGSHLMKSLKFVHDKDIHVTKYSCDHYQDNKDYKFCTKCGKEIYKKQILKKACTDVYLADGQCSSREIMSILGNNKVTGLDIDFQY